MVKRLENPRFARAYLRLAPQADLRGVGEHRDRLLAGLAGVVCELGAGQGLNFARYPTSVTRVVAIEPEPILRVEAARLARSAAVPVAVVSADAAALPLADGSCDAVVASLMLCSVESQPAVLAEARRVLRPGGVLAFYEHVRSSHALVGALEDLATPLWRRLAGGCHPNRDTARAVAEAGFAVEALERFGYSPGSLVPPTAHVIGRARRG
ncbi:class I SAM-dependent methyltransferase [Oryzihumus sp.]|uniref:class I SAM-dependent methyltransferase n=1 Tax=Oryzihumus sp. TaxID=1968903 RepID=UPI002EDB986D